MKYYVICYLNTSFMTSDICHVILKNYPNISFALCYSHNPTSNNYTYSLRSTDNNASVINVAKLYNGGGHRNSCGMIHNESKLGRIIGMNSIYEIISNTKIITINYISNGLVKTKNLFVTKTYDKKTNEHLGIFMLQKKYSIKKSNTLFNKYHNINDDIETVKKINITNAASIFINNGYNSIDNDALTKINMAITYTNITQNINSNYSYITLTYSDNTFNETKNIFDYLVKNIKYINVNNNSRSNFYCSTISLKNHVDI